MKNTVYLRLLLLFLLSGACLEAIGQNLPNKILDFPQRYKGKVSDCEIDYDASSGPVLNGKVWNVYVGREGIRSTSTPGGGKDMGRLTFLDHFYVAGESGSYIRLITDPSLSYTGEIGKDAKDYGWVKKEDMVLWDHCLVTCNRAKLDKKAMVLNTLESLKTGLDKYQTLESNAPKFYKDPEMKIAGGKVAGLFQFYFVFKITDNAILLGKDVSVSHPDQVKSIILGWVDRKKLVAWDQRVALEPNSDIEAARERRARSGERLARVFKDPGNARRYKEVGIFSNKSNLWSADPLETRPIGEWRRFPVLDTIKDGIARVGAMGDTYFGAGKAGAMSAENTAAVLNTHRRHKAEVENIDIVFVMDATSSMGPYFKPISEALVETMGELRNRQDNKFNYRFGAVAYRDYAEGSRMIESRRLTSDGTEVATFLSGIEAKDYRDKDLGEAVHKGLEQAILGVGMSQTHTNVLIWVGDAANHTRSDESQVLHEDLINLLTEYKCNMLAFQARHPEGETYDKFSDGAKNLIESTVYNIYKLTKAQFVNDPAAKKPPMSDEKDNLWRVEASLAGAVLSCPVNRELAPERLKKEILAIVKDTENHMKNVLEGAEEMFVDGASFKTVTSKAPVSASPYTSNFTKAILLYLAEAGLNEQQTQMVTSQSYQLFISDVYAPLEVYDLKYPLFKPVLFLSRIELGQLLLQIEKLVDADTREGMRDHFYNTWVELLRQHVGNVEREEMDDMSMEDVSNKIFGLPATSSLLSEVKLKDILDRKKVTDQEVADYANQIRAKIKQLSNIFNERLHLYSFESGDKTYYWIQQDLLP